VPTAGAQITLTANGMGFNEIGSDNIGDAIGWFDNIPAGLTVTSAQIPNAQGGSFISAASGITTTLVLGIGGTPLEGANGNIEMTIPASAVRGAAADFKVTIPNGWNIVAPADKASMTPVEVSGMAGFHSSTAAEIIDGVAIRTTSFFITLPEDSAGFRASGASNSATAYAYTPAVLATWFTNNNAVALFTAGTGGTGANGRLEVRIHGSDGTGTGTVEGGAKRIRLQISQAVSTEWPLLSVNEMMEITIPAAALAGTITAPLDIIPETNARFVIPGIVTGVVGQKEKDTNNNTAVVSGGADVRLMRGSTVVATTRTNDKGEFTFRHVPANEEGYSVQVSKEDYGTETVFINTFNRSVNTTVAPLGVNVGGTDPAITGRASTILERRFSLVRLQWAEELILPATSGTATFRVRDDQGKTYTQRGATPPASGPEPDMVYQNRTVTLTASLSGNRDAGIRRWVVNGVDRGSSDTLVLAPVGEVDLVITLEIETKVYTGSAFITEEAALAALTTNPDASFIDLASERITIGVHGFTPAVFSIDGGQRWRAVGVGGINAQLPRLLNRDMSLVLSDKAPVRGQLPMDARRITFPQINGRPKLDRLQPHYGIVQGSWVLSTRGGTTAATQQGALALEIARPSASNARVPGVWEAAPAGTTAIPALALTTARTTNFFVRTAPSVEGTGANQVFTAASAPRRFAVRGFSKAPTYRLRMNAEGGATLNLKAGTIVGELLGTSTATELLERPLTSANNGDIIELTMAGTDRKPPSLTQRLSVAGIKAAN
jgi:hypothetical protein